MRTIEQVQADIDALNKLFPRPAKVAMTLKRICDAAELEGAVEIALQQPGVSIVSLRPVTDIE
jgi:hypothetical protein